MSDGNMRDCSDQIARAIRESIAENFPNMRDYFAAQALQGILNGTGPIPERCEADAKIAYDYAEAMLAERSKRMGGS